MKIAFPLGPVNFPSKSAAQEAVRIILQSNNIGHILTGEPEQIVHSLFKLHPRYEEKTDNQYSHIVIRRLSDYGRQDRGFMIVRKDGTEVDIGYRDIFKQPGVQKSDTEHFYKAARHAVASTTATFKLAAFKGDRDSLGYDAVTGERLTFRDAHVDHAPPWEFKKIANKYLELYGRQPIRDVAAHRELPPEAASRFLKFHNSLAILRIIHRSDNIARRYDQP